MQPIEANFTKSFFYFVRFASVGLQFYDANFKQVEPLSINGLFSFVCYHNFVIVSRLIGYASCHQGLITLVNILNPQLKNYRYAFFSDPLRYKISHGKPISGGGVWFDKGEVILWHLKSGSISLKNPACHDNHPDLELIVKKVGFPEKTRLTISQAEWFEVHYMRSLFLENGGYKDDKVFSKDDMMFENIVEMSLGRVDNSSFEGLRPAICSRDPEILPDY